MRERKVSGNHTAVMSRKAPSTTRRTFISEEKRKCGRARAAFVCAPTEMELNLQLSVFMLLVHGKSFSAKKTTKKNNNMWCVLMLVNIYYKDALTWMPIHIRANSQCKSQQLLNMLLNHINVMLWLFSVSFEMPQIFICISVKTYIHNHNAVIVVPQNDPSFVVIMSAYTILLPQCALFS